MIRFKENNCTANMKQNLLLGNSWYSNELMYSIDLVRMYGIYAIILARTIVNMFIFKFFAKVGT